MESTWETRDRPVLAAIVAAFDSDPDRKWLTIDQVAPMVGMEVPVVYRAVRALADTYLTLELLAFGADDPIQGTFIHGVTPAARPAVGQWPSLDAWADRIIQGLLEAAEREPDEAKKSRLQAAGEALGGFRRDVLVGVLSGTITQGVRS